MSASVNPAFSAVEKHSSELVRYLSSGIVDINEFGVKLVSAQFTGSSALNNALSGTGVTISEKATRLCLIVSTQIELEPGKYFKKFLKILNGYSSINQLDENISEEYEALKSASQPNHTDAPDGGGPEVGVAELRNVMCVADLRKLLSDAEAEKERALEQVKAAEKKIKLLKEKIAELLHVEADPSRCVAEGAGLSGATLDMSATFSVTVVDEDNRPCEHSSVKLTARLQSLVDESVEEFEAKRSKSGTAGVYEVRYRPTQRGRHKLSVAVNGTDIPDSPFDVYVSIPAGALGKPVRVIDGVSQPRCVAINSESKLVVSEFAGHKVSILEKGGEKYLDFGSRGENNLEFHSPCGVSVDSDDCIFVAEIGNNRIQKFTRRGIFLNSVGADESENVQFNGPNGLKIYADKLYVCDTDNHRVLVYDTELKYLSQVIGSGPGQLNQPWDISWDSSFRLYVTDSGNHRVCVFDQHGTYLREFCLKSSGHSYERHFDPTCIHIDHDRVYITEYNNNRVSVLDTDGQYLCAVGDRPGCEVGTSLQQPFGITVDKDGFVYVCNMGNHCILVF